MDNKRDRPASFIQSAVAAAKAALEKARLKHRKGDSGKSMIKTEDSFSRPSSSIPLTKPIPSVLSLKVDSLGRPIDDEGRVIELKPKIQNTLKINQSMQSNRENTVEEKVVKKVSDKKPEQLQGWYDPTIVQKKKNRKMAFCFVEKDKYVKLERQMQREIEDKTLGSDMKKLVQHKKKYLEIQERRLKEMAKNKKKSEHNVNDSGMEIDDENANLVPIGERQVKSWEQEPEIEWWDLPLLKKYEESDQRNSSYQPFLPLLPDYYINEKKITYYISHPSPLKADEFKSHSIPNIYLTVKERKKLRRRNRQEKEKAKQDKIRIGLLPPPPPKVKLSNLMRVLSSSLVANPSKIEYEVRAQMEQRLRAHDMRNQARKLKPEERARKHANKWKLTIGEVVHVSLFSISNLENSKLLFKIDINAQQFHLTGFCIVCPDTPAMIVVEGGAIAIKRYRKLLLSRMSWEGETCKLLWQGQATHRNFGNWKVSIVHSETEAKDLLGECAYYYDMLKEDFESGCCQHPSGIASMALED